MDKKSKKTRRASISATVAGVGGGMELGSDPTASRGATPAFDYTYVKKDLARIGILAGSFIVIMVVLSFFIK